MRILIVEDEAKIRKGIANLIEHHTEHLVIGEARDGIEGKEMALLYRPDLIITDIRMPGIDGLEMIRLLKEESDAWKFVILSGYSEFEYAKKALRYGVEDYLVKPLAPEDITGLLDAVQEKINTELKKTQGRQETMMRDYLTGNGKEGIGELISACDLKESDALILLGAYTGNLSAMAKEKCLQVFEKWKKAYPGASACFFFMDSTKEFICVIKKSYYDEIREELERIFLNRLPQGEKWVWAACGAENAGLLKDAYEQLKGLYFYGMVSDGGAILTAKALETFKPQPCRYPRHLEHELQKAFYQENKENFTEAERQFTAYMETVKARPGEIKDSYMKMVDFLTNLAQENNPKAYEQILSLYTVMEIGAAVTMAELEKVLHDVSDILLQCIRQTQGISNYTIKKAIDYIRLHYHENISLEKVAAKLDITPEYLSTLFNREMGVNYSAFLKKFRISHAKRLLKNSDKKIYEIAADVGYNDPKYFNRVFKEEERMSPGDFRSLHRQGI